MGYTAQLIGIAIFVFGLLAGSFLNALIYRLSTKTRSIFDKHSICPRCKHELVWYDLVPLLSFVILRGKCRYCGKPISWQYPAVELTTAAAFVLIYLHTGLSLTTYYLLLTTCFLIVIFVYDLKYYLILDKVVFPAAALALMYQGYQGNWGPALLGAALLFGFFLLLHSVSKGRWIGFGDVKLGFFLGLLVPWPGTLVVFFFAYVLGALFALLLVALKAKRLSDRVPFGTFLTLSAFLSMLWGEKIATWYLQLIGIR